MELKFEYIHPSRYRIVGTDVTMHEEEARDLMVQQCIKESRLSDVEDEVVDKIIKDKGSRVSISFVNECMAKHGFDISANDGFLSKLWSFLHSWYQTNRSYYGFLNPLLHIEQ